MQHLHYPIRIEQHDVHRYTVQTPALPGCCISGNSRDEAVNFARELIESYLEHLTLGGHPVPLESKDITFAESFGSIEMLCVRAPLAVIM